MVLFARGVFDVHAESLQSTDLGIIELKHDSERTRSRQRAIGVERVTEIFDRKTVDHLGWAIGTHCDDREAESRQLLLDFAQLAELRIAIGSPASAIEDDQRPVIQDHFGEIDPITL